MATNDVQYPDQPSKPHPALNRLDVLIGRWKASGQTVATDTEPAVDITGTDSYEWLGEYFVVHRVDVTFGDAKVEAVEIIGDYDAASGTYAARSFDTAGNFVTMRASVAANGAWTFAGDAERATLNLGADGQTMAAEWERQTGPGIWRPWMTMRFTRVSSATSGDVSTEP